MIIFEQSFLANIVDMNWLLYLMCFSYKDKYLKSQEYTITNSKFAYFTSTFSLIISLWFILSGFYNTIDLYVRSYNYSDIVSGLLFFAALFVISDVIRIPLSLYQTL